MYRNQEKQLDRWYKKKKRKPLIIRGARQVGKSTLVRNFAGNHSLNLFEINLERHVHLDRIFKTTNIPDIIREIEGIIGRKISYPNSLLFLDEIQATPSAIPALRYFLEDQPELPVVAAGSLLEFTLSEHSFSMPVGRVEYMHMGPMVFQEFLRELDPFAFDFVENFAFGAKIPDSVHNLLLNRQREYLLTGGMPEAVSVYSLEKDFFSVQEVHDSIISTYYDDFGKYASKNELARLQTLFRLLPRHTGKKIVYSRIYREERTREAKAAIELLTKARLITKVIHTHANGVPLGADAVPEVYKTIFIDVGLSNYMCGLDWRALNSMDERELINEGSMAEQFIGQHLVSNMELNLKQELYYWLREGKSKNAEIDFLIPIGKDIIPVEVKAGKRGSLKSLVQFALDKHIRLAVRFDLNKPSKQKVQYKTGENTAVEYELLSLPMYLVDKTVNIYVSES